MTDVVNSGSAVQSEIPLAQQSQSVDSPVTAKQRNYLMSFVDRQRDPLKKKSLTQAVEAIQTRAEASAMLTSLQAIDNTRQLSPALVNKAKQLGVALRPVNIGGKTIYFLTEHSTSYSLLKAVQQAHYSLMQGQDPESTCETLILQVTKLVASTAKFAELHPSTNRDEVQTESIWNYDSSLQEFQKQADVPPAEI